MELEIFISWLWKRDIKAENRDFETENGEVWAEDLESFSLLE